jgi:glycosyltransferase involved in cell wall biosynthesis
MAAPDEMPIVCSVIIPSYNRANWLPRCVDSVRQSGIRGLEIVVVDDGSTDDTREVIRRLGPDIRYLYQPHAGVASARNRGARACRGRYLVFLDSDDAWLPDGLERFIELMEAHSEVAVGFGDVLVGNPGVGYSRMLQRRAMEVFRRLPCRELAADFRILERRSFFRAMTLRTPIILGATILRRDVFERAGGFDEDLNGGEDWELCMRLAAEYSFAFFDRVLSIWERHDGSLSSDADHMKREGILALGKVLAGSLPLAAEDLRPARLYRARLMDEWAYMAFDRGDVAAARERFVASMKYGGVRPWRLFYWCCCRLGPRTVRRLRTLKWRIAEVRARGRDATAGRPCES